MKMPTVHLSDDSDDEVDEHAHVTTEDFTDSDSLTSPTVGLCIQKSIKDSSSTVL